VKQHQTDVSDDESTQDETDYDDNSGSTESPHNLSCDQPQILSNLLPLKKRKRGENDCEIEEGEIREAIV
jgi:hypothetical protein